MFENIEKIIRQDIGIIHIEEERYGTGLLAGFDIGVYRFTNNATNVTDATIVYEGTEVAEAIDAAASPGDLDALTALSKLADYAEQHPEFLFARATSLDEVLTSMEDKAKKWNQLSQEQQEKLLLDFVVFEGSSLI